MLQAKHTDYDGAFLLAAATEQCHTWRKWDVDSAQLCQAFRKKRGKRLHGKKQVATVAVESSSMEGYGRDPFKNLDLVKLYKVNNPIKISPSKRYDELGTMIN